MAFACANSFAQAYRLHKTIGTLPWLWYVRATGTFTSPTRQLLHYPVPMKLVDGFANHVRAVVFHLIITLTEN